MQNVAPRNKPYETLPGILDPEIPALAPQPEGETPDIQRVLERFPKAIISAGTHLDQQIITVRPSQLVQVVEFLKTDPDLAYEALIDVSSIDQSELPIAESDSRFVTTYQLRSYRNKKHMMLLCPLADAEYPVAPSLTTIFEGANWPERETYDLMGIQFSGHPDLRRILMPEHWPYYPLRKDIPEGGEPVPFSLTWGDAEFETLGKQILPAESIAPKVPPGMKREHMIINMGPHHPSTHGVLRLVVELEGEEVIDVDPDIGYLHSGFEKTGENKRYKDFVYYTDRMDYLSSMTNNLGYVLAVEKLLDIEIPERAQVIRVIMNELQRIASHLMWLGTHVLDVSGTGMSLLMYATRERERILDLFEMVCGGRLTLSYIRIGGVWKDLPSAFIPHLQALVDMLPEMFDDYEDMLTSGPLWEERLEGVGYLSRDDAINMGLTGPMLRGSGVDWDLRRDQPYSGYENYEFEVPVSQRGDCYGRYIIRMQEMRQSVRIIQQAIERLPDGDYRTDNRKVSLPPRAELDVSMEALIHHFKLMTEGMHPPPGMVYYGIEGSKGELGYFVYCDGTAIPYRLHVRGASFNNLYAIRKMSRGAMLSDVVTNIGSIDIVLGEVDR